MQGTYILATPEAPEMRQITIPPRSPWRMRSFSGAMMPDGRSYIEPITTEAQLVGQYFYFWHPGTKHILRSVHRKHAQVAHEH